MESPKRWSAACMFVLVLVPAVPLHGHDGDHPPARVPDKVAHRPSAIPDRIILTWTGDPAHTQAATWRTDTTVKKALAEIARAEKGPKFVRSKRPVTAVTTPLKTDLGDAHYHTVNFEGLAPRTKYVYRVGDGTNWSEWIHFNTASDRADKFSFVYFGDAQNDIKSLWSRIVREAYSDAPKTSFLLHAGDLINRANADAEWGEWFYAAGFINAMIPSIATPGNHEYVKPAKDPKDSKEVKEAKDSLAPPTLSNHWRPQFAFPANGPSGLEETVYYLDYQGVRIVSLNSNVEQARQVPWLEQVLSRNPNRWTILTFHHPIHSVAKGRDNPKLREAWQPIFDKYRVDLVLTGHDHTYARSGLETYRNVAWGANVRDPKTGTVYVVSVSGPKMYVVEPQPWMKKSAQDTQLYQIITIDGGNLTYEARTATGDLYDAFELRKRQGAVNELIEKGLEKVENKAAGGVP